MHLRPLLISTLWLAATLPAQAQMFKDPQLEGLYRADKLAEVEKLGLQRLASQTDDAQAVLALAVGALRSNDAGRRKTAIGHAEGCVQKQPRAAPCHYALGVVLGVQAMSEGMLKMAGSVGRVRESLVEALTLEPGWFPARSAVVEFYLVAPGIIGGSASKAQETARAAARPEQARRHWRAAWRCRTRSSSAPCSCWPRCARAAWDRRRPRMTAARGRPLRGRRWACAPASAPCSRRRARDLLVAVGGDQLAFGEGLEADQRPREAEVRVLTTQVCSSSKRRAGAAAPVPTGSRSTRPKCARKSSVTATASSPWPAEMLAAFGHHRHAVVARCAMRPCWTSGVPVPKPCGITRCTAGGRWPGRRAIALPTRVDPEGLHVLRGGVQVEDVVGRRHHRAQLARAAQFGAVFVAVEPGLGPDAVQVVHQLPAVEGPLRVEVS
jgi:hypothetical protein